MSTVPIQNLRSGVASKRPVATGLAVGEIAINYNEVDPAIYLRGNADALVKVAPVYVGSGAPNATPASGGASGNSIGEQWLDKSVTPPVQKVWDGSTWVQSFTLASGTITNGEINASAAIELSKLATGALPSGITVSSSNLVDGTIVDADINASAAISLSKLATGSLPSGITVASSNLVDGTIVDADINAAAAIGLSKLATGALPSGITVSTDNLVNGTIVDADINAVAAISLSKLATGGLPSGITVSSDNIIDGTIVNADINASAAIAYSKLALTGSIVNADIGASAAIADSKLATISTAGKVSNSATTATNVNTANAIVARDASGNFSAGTITATLNGNASTATSATTATTATTATSATSATSAATLTTARTINGVSFNGSANIETNPFSTGGTAYSNGFGGRYVSTSSPSGGNNGDIWYQV